MILATVVMLFQIPVGAQAVKPVQQPAQQSQAILMADNQPSIPMLRSGDSTDTAKSSTRTSADRENARVAFAEHEDAKILAANDPAKTLGVDNEAASLSAVSSPESVEPTTTSLDGHKDVLRTGKVRMLVTGFPFYRHSR
jgi:hypothetical protein